MAGLRGTELVFCEPPLLMDRYRAIPSSTRLSMTAERNPNETRSSDNSPDANQDRDTSQLPVTRRSALASIFTASGFAIAPGATSGSVPDVRSAADQSDPGVIESFEDDNPLSEYTFKGAADDWTIADRASDGKQSLTPTTSGAPAVYRTDNIIERGQTYTVDYYLDTLLGDPRRFHDPHFIFAVKDENNYYDCVINNGGLDLTLWKVKEGERVKTSKADNSGGVTNLWGTLEVSLEEDGTISCSIVGATVEITDEEFETGGYGFYTSGSASSIYLDNVRGAASEQGVSLDFTDVRTAQGSENTRVTTGGVNYTVPDPDLVSAKDAGIFFGFSNQNVDSLPQDKTVDIEVDQVTDQETITETISISTKTISRLVNEDPVTVFDDSSVTNPPVISPEAKLKELTVRIPKQQVGSVTLSEVTTTLTEGDDFNVRPLEGLNIGVIAVKDPTGGDNYAGKNGDGKVANFLDLVERIEDYIPKVFPVNPGGLSVYRQSVDIAGKEKAGEYRKDFQAARDELERAFDVDLDVTLAIVPGEEVTPPGSGKIPGDGYWKFHNELGRVGLHVTGVPDQPQVATAVEPQYNALGNLTEFESTVAQEFAHHFLPDFDRADGSGDSTRIDPVDDSDRKLYNEPAARRRDHNPGDKIDNAHARDTLVSTAYNFEAGNNGYTLYGTDVSSFMAYVRGDRYADSFVYQKLIDDGFDPTPREDAGGLNPLSVSASAEDESDILVGIGNSANEELSISRFDKRPGRPSPGRGGSITVEVRDVDGSAIDSRKFSDQVMDHAVKFIDGEFRDEHPVPDGEFIFAVPYPDQTADLRFIEKESDNTLVVIPQSRTLRAAIERLPDSAFVNGVTARREALLNKVMAIRRMAEAKNYRGAAQKARYDLRKAIDEWIRETYDNAANQPTEEDLLNIVDDTISRFETLASELTGKDRGKN